MPPLFAAFGVFAISTLSAAVWAAEAGPASSIPTEFGEMHSTGADVAAEFSKATGVAITPLLGMSFLGAKKWLGTPAEMRAKLPWYDQPYFWGTGLVLIGILWFGHRLPVIKRGFKLIKVWESKASALVAIPAVGQSILAALPQLQAPGATTLSPLSWLMPTAHAAEAASGSTPAIAVAGTVMVASMCLVGGAVVWLMFHTINVIVLLSPIGVVDWVLKGVRVAALAVLLLAIAISPWLGAAVSAVYVLLAMLVAGWSFRLMIFGAVFTADFMTFRWRRQKLGLAGIEVFSDSGLPTVPVRTWGRLHAEAGVVVFKWRPFLLLGTRQVRIEGPLFIGRGLLSPLLMSGASATAGEQSAIARFPPRFRGHGPALVTALSVSGEQDVGLQKGVKAAMGWIRSQLTFRPGNADAVKL